MPMVRSILRWPATSYFFLNIGLKLQIRTGLPIGRPVFLLASDLSAAQLSLCRLTAQVTIGHAGCGSRRFAGGSQFVRWPAMLPRRLVAIAAVTVSVHQSGVSLRNRRT